jgi:hypothetical protein
MLKRIVITAVAITLTFASSVMANPTTASDQQTYQAVCPPGVTPNCGPAVGDGVTDDTANLRTAALAAVTAGLDLDLGNHSYLVSSTGGVNWTSSGGELAHLHVIGYGSTLLCRNGNTYACVDMTGTALARIEGLNLLMNGTQATQSGAGVLVGRLSSCASAGRNVFRDLYIKYTAVPTDYGLVNFEDEQDSFYDPDFEDVNNGFWLGTNTPPVKSSYQAMCGGGNTMFQTTIHNGKVYTDGNGYGMVVNGPWVQMLNLDNTIFSAKGPSAPAYAIKLKPGTNLSVGLWTGEIEGGYTGAIDANGSSGVVTVGHFDFRMNIQTATNSTPAFDFTNDFVLNNTFTLNAPNANCAEPLWIANGATFSDNLINANCQVIQSSTAASFQLQQGMTCTVPNNTNCNLWNNGGNIIVGSWSSWN